LAGKRKIPPQVGYDHDKLSTGQETALIAVEHGAQPGLNNYIRLLTQDNAVLRLH
jgi:hypothetical protein